MIILVNIKVGRRPSIKWSWGSILLSDGELSPVFLSALKSPSALTEVTHKVDAALYSLISFLQVHCGSPSTKSSTISLPLG